MIDPALCPEGEQFSASDPLKIVLIVLAETDFGVTFLVGTAAALNPALRNCSLLVCLEVPGPDSGRGGVGWSSSSGQTFTAGESKGCDMVVLQLLLASQERSVQRGYSVWSYRTSVANAEDNVVHELGSYNGGAADGTCYGCGGDGLLMYGLGCCWAGEANVDRAECSLSSYIRSTLAYSSTLRVNPVG